MNNKMEYLTRMNIMRSRTIVDFLERTEIYEITNDQFKSLSATWIKGYPLYTEEEFEATSKNHSYWSNKLYSYKSVRKENIIEKKTVKKEDLKYGEWSKQEVNTLKCLSKRKVERKLIAKKLNRTIESIKSKKKALVKNGYVF